MPQFYFFSAEDQKDPQICWFPASEVTDIYGADDGISTFVNLRNPNSPEYRIAMKPALVVQAVVAELGQHLIEHSTVQSIPLPHLRDPSEPF